MNNYETTSLIGTGIGTAIGWYFGGPIGGAVVGSLFGSLLGGMSSVREQRKQQERLAKAQIDQSNLLREKIKADNAALYSSAQSAIAQRSGAMGAVY